MPSPPVFFPTLRRPFVKLLIGQRTRGGGRLVFISAPPFERPQKSLVRKYSFIPKNRRFNDIVLITLLDLYYLYRLLRYRDDRDRRQ